MIIGKKPLELYPKIINPINYIFVYRAYKNKMSATKFKGKFKRIMIAGSFNGRFAFFATIPV